MAERTSKADGNSDSLDPFRMKLSVDDFKSMDQDSSSSLSLNELTKASESGLFTGSKQEAVDSMRDFLKQIPTQKIDDGHESIPVLQAWDPFDVATKNISSKEFRTIDKDKNGVLSKIELQDAVSTDGLSAVDKVAASFLSDALDHSWDVRGVIGPDGINDWHDLNDKFKSDSRDALEGMTTAIRPRGTTDAGPITEVFDEIMRRDEIARPRDTEQLLAEILLCQKALKEDKKIERDSDGKLQLGSQSLDENGRTHVHKFIADCVTSFDRQRRGRLDYALALLQVDKVSDAERLYREAEEGADKVFRKYRVDNSEVTMADIIKDELAQLKIDKPKIGETPSKYFEESLKNVLQAPIDTRVEFAIGYTAPFMSLSKEKLELKFDSMDPNFQPDKAQKLIDEARIYTISILGFDPQQPYAGAQYPERVSLLQRQWRDLDPLVRYNLYIDENHDGKSDFLQKLKTNAWWGKWFTGTDIDAKLDPTNVIH